MFTLYFMSPFRPSTQPVCLQAKREDKKYSPQSSNTCSERLHRMADPANNDNNACNHFLRYRRCSAYCSTRIMNGWFVFCVCGWVDEASYNAYCSPLLRIRVIIHHQKRFQSVLVIGRRISCARLGVRRASALS